MHAAAGAGYELKEKLLMDPDALPSGMVSLSTPSTVYLSRAWLMLSNSPSPFGANCTLRHVRCKAAHHITHSRMVGAGDWAEKSMVW